jgi:DNA invertase Pin-like site-specific DNA recombinase
MVPNNELLQDLQPRPKRKRNRKSSDRGLPPDAELHRLAQTYLESQRDYWPQLASAGILPEPTDTVLNQMVDEYKERHRTGKIDGDDLLSRLGSTERPRLAAFYGRYSCDNSSPLSIIDQMHNCLVKAKDEGRFIPWEFIIADYSVSGLDSGRRGYVNCKTLIKHQGDAFDTIYIDDFTRASRDSLEWWRLAAACQRAKKRLIGASDGFDLSSPDWEVKVAVSGLVSQLHIRGLREKVIRGMKGAARRHTVLGKPPLGFTRKIVRDEDGQIVRRPSGKPLHELAIESEFAELVRRIFRLFVVKLWSPYRIAKRFNARKHEGTDTWTESTIKKILKNPASIGVFIWNRTHTEFDYETEKWIKVPNPRSEWIVDYDPSLAIVSLDDWRNSQRRRSACRRGRRGDSPPSRNQCSATTLLSGTLHCGYCGRELTLCRSAGKYKNMFCTNGRVGVHGCQLSTTKSTRIIEECVLAHLKDVLLTESALAELVQQANQHLAELANRPTVDVAPFQSQMKGLQIKIDRLVSRVANLPDEKEDLREGYERQIIQLQKEVNGLRYELRKADNNNSAPPPPIAPDAVKRYLDDIRDVLNQEIPQAAEAIRQLTGPIEVRQEKVEGRRGARWIATFTPNVRELLRHVSQTQDYPDSVTLESLCRAKWITAPSVDVPIEKVPEYERLAPKFKELRDGGRTIHEIASRHKVAWQVAYETLQFAETGDRPLWYASDDPVRYAGWKHFQDVAPVVAELRDQEKMNWLEITDETLRRTGYVISAVTALRAYEHAHRRETRQSSGIGTDFRPRSGQEKFEQFCELVKKGVTNGAELGRRVGVSRSTAHRWKKGLA